MCGIAGTFHYKNQQPVEFDTLHAMTSSLRHRGPDEDGYYMNPTRTLGLGHRRLSIIDIAAGKQPISNEDGTVHIIFNGEIYNYKPLREWLANCGHTFKTSSDTEVILHLFEEEGIAGFAHLNGIFAVAIYDERNDTLTLARDRFGVKPLYYSDVQGKLLFGSEMKAILCDESQERSLDLVSLGSFLTYRFNPSPQTLFTGIEKLAPGHVLMVSSSHAPRIMPFRTSSPQTFSHISESEAVGEYTRLFRQAVERQMVSDVPVGLLLSGGIDSALIGSVMQEHAGYPVRSYTIGFEGSGDYNEIDDARRTAQLLGLEHSASVITKQQYLDFFIRSFYYTEEPVAMTTIPAMYYVSQRAARDVKVVLAGQGADEPLGGYDRYTGEKIISDYGALLRMLPLEAIARFLPRNEKIKRALFALRHRSESERFLGIHTIFTPAMKEQLFHKHLYADVIDKSLAFIEQLAAQTHGLADSLSRLLYIDARLQLPDNLLLFNDKMSMANSLEMRVPFLDNDLMDFMESLPSHLKLKGRFGNYTAKYIHKKASEKLLPAEIINRKKRGFSTPMDEWLQGDFSATVKRLFNEPDSAVGRYFNTTYINQMILLHQTKRENYQRHLFALLSFELWHRNFFEKTLHPDEVFAL
ncbi:MAG: asparagine synthase (glutamine-hydrolyzing) [Candidatus Kapabacteria bacterium]|nr:asparagine synthase (glutamine-hydrolyzing) [Candidatus Kapabacteria bacterium]